jgi:ATP-binding cassette subfamily C protein CydC
VRFSIEQGQRLAIIGASGSGKTTIVNLLLRFWDYEIGHIKLDHNELRDYHSDDLRGMISVISQYTHIFNSTIRDNLHLANPAATEEELLNACRLAQLDRFINSLPLGFDTLTGENGLLLSGGERQRLAVARAILKDAPILILDEATANLDAETERQLWKALEEVMVGRTTLIISHRTDIIPEVDKLVYL